MSTDKSAPGARCFETRLPTATPPGDDDLTWFPAWRIRAAVAAKKLSPVQVVDHFLGRIEKLQPQLHAFRQTDEEAAREQARRLEDAVMRGEPLGPLHGVPVGTKQVLPIRGLEYSDMGRGMVVAERDAVEIERLRAAGAVIVGPTVAGLVSREFGDSDRMPLNPWDTERVCGDSSSGSACAAAAAMTPITIGGDGYGSTRAPAAFCGLIGVHPTRGRVPSFESSTLQTRPLTTYGPMARDVRDAATVLSVLAGPDGRDMMCLQDDPPDYLARLDGGAKGLRLGWTDDFGYASEYAVEETPRVLETVRAAVWRLKDAGAEIEPIEATIESPIRAGNKWVASDAAISADYVLGFKPPSREEILQARESRRRLWETLRATTARHDLIVCPTVREVAPTRKQWAIDGITPDFAGIFLAMTAVANVLGWPAVTVPAGLVDGLPVGLQIIGRPNSEPRIFQLAQAFLAVQ